MIPKYCFIYMTPMIWTRPLRERSLQLNLIVRQPIGAFAVAQNVTCFLPRIPEFGPLVVNSEALLVAGQKSEQCDGVEVPGSHAFPRRTEMTKMLDAGAHACAN